MAASPLSGLAQRVARAQARPLSRHLHTLLFGRAFTGRRARRLLVLFNPDRISYASAYPFLHYAERFAEAFDAEIRLFPVERALSSGLPKGLRGATHVLVQARLLDPPEKHAALARFLGALPQDIVKAFSDTYANADIRLAAVLSDLDLYFKKSLFADPRQFLGATYGHTNLTAYYSRLYGLHEEMKDWQVPRSALAKLRLAPNFLTDPDLLAMFLERRDAPPQSGRRIDVHARLGGTGAPGFYGESRRHAARAVEALDDLVLATGGRVNRTEYMDELRQARLCFSPFGYGELCWRDIEAVAAGAVLVKPDMSHLRTEPDLYRDDETYVACRWDFSDLEEKVRALLGDEDRRRRIATNAWNVARDYLNGGGPVATYADLFRSPETLRVGR